MTMIVSLGDPTQIILNQLATRITQRSVALSYAVAIQSREPIDWATVNKAITARWSPSGLERVKKMAWKIVRDMEDCKQAKRSTANEQVALGRTGTDGNQTKA